MHVPTKARLAVAAVAASAVSMGVAAPSFAAAPSHSGGTVAPNVLTGVKTPVTVTITTPPGATNPNTRTITWSLPAGAPAPTGSWDVNFHDASAHPKVTVPAGTLTVNHDFVLGAGITYDTFSVGVSATDKTTGNTWSGSATVTIGTPQHGGAIAPQVSVTPGITVPVNTQITATAIKGAVAAGGNLRYEFDFGDPAKTPQNVQVVYPPATDPNKTGTALYTYTVAGTYKLVVTTTDGTNKANSTPITITVTNGTGGGGGGGTGTGPAVDRLWGQDRYGTGIAVSQRGFPTAGSAQAVVLATGDKFADALSGVPLAKKVGGPLLLTPSAGPNDQVTNEIKRVLKPGGIVYVLGGTAAVPDTVVNALGLPAAQIVHLAGPDRFATSLKIAGALGSPKNVVVARGDDGTNLNGFADALAAGPYAANVFGGGGAAVLLTNGTTLDQNIKTYLQGATSIQAIGGPAATAIAGFSNAKPAIIGGDRFQTAADVAAQFTTVKGAGIAYGFKFADALTGAALLANGNGPLLLTDSSALPPASALALNGIGHALGAQGTIDVFGGSAVITDGVKAAVATTAGGHVVP